MTLFHDVNQLKTAGWDKGCTQFQHRGCVVLQSPAISLFTEVKAVSCSVPGASIPVQWLMQACTGTLCCLSIQCTKSCSWAANSHHQLSSKKNPALFSSVLDPHMVWKCGLDEEQWSSPGLSSTRWRPLERAVRSVFDCTGEMFDADIRPQTITAGLCAGYTNHQLNMGNCHVKSNKKGGRHRLNHKQCAEKCFLTVSQPHRWWVPARTQCKWEQDSQRL